MYRDLHVDAKPRLTTPNSYTLKEHAQQKMTLLRQHTNDLIFSCHSCLCSNSVASPVCCSGWPQPCPVTTQQRLGCPGFRAIVIVDLSNTKKRRISIAVALKINFRVISHASSYLKSYFRFFYFILLLVPEVQTTFLTAAKVTN